MKKYFPILLSKSGEFAALDHLAQNVKDAISPIIEVLPGDADRTAATFISSWTFVDNELLLDFSLYDPFDRTVVRKLIVDLLAAGVNVIPVIQQNSDPRYIGLVQNLVASKGINVAIRTSNESGGFVNYNTTVTALRTNVGTTRQRTKLIIDLGYVENSNYNIFGAFAANLIAAIPNRNQYTDVVVASGSFLQNLTPLPARVQPHRLQRYEWDIWQLLQATAGITGAIKYSDYGNKNPLYVPVNYSGSCSIKYTTAKNFVIYRGDRAQDHADGNGQYITLSRRLIATPDYSGIGFCWGDAEIERISREVMTNPRKRPGSASTWVQITQNHHITLLHGLL